MSSSVEQESRVDSQVARALEAAKNPFLREIAERFQREPNQILKLSEILGFTTEEEKNAKALVWLKKHEPEKYQAVLQSSEAENKIQEEKEMEVMWGEKRFMRKLEDIVKRTLGRGDIFPKIDVTPNSIRCDDKLDSPELIIYVTSARLNGEIGSRFWIDGHCQPIAIRVYQYRPVYLKRAKEFAQMYEDLTRRVGPLARTAYVLKEY